MGSWKVQLCSFDWSPSPVFNFCIMINPNCSDDEGEPDDDDDNEDDDDDNEDDEDDNETDEDEEKEHLDEEHSKENGVNCNGNSPSSKLQSPVRKLVKTNILTTLTLLTMLCTFYITDCVNLFNL